MVIDELFDKAFANFSFCPEDNFTPYLMYDIVYTYSRTPLTRTPKGNEKQFELAGVRISGVGINFRFSVNN